MSLKLDENYEKTLLIRNQSMISRWTHRWTDGQKDRQTDNLLMGWNEM